MRRKINFDFVFQSSYVVKQDSKVQIVLGQLVNATYIDSICEEINEALQLHGTVSINQLTKDYDLPSEFLQEEIFRRLGSIIEGFRDENDPKTILTPSFVVRNKAKIRGALSAITVPTSVATIVNRFKISEKLFFTLAEELIRTKRLAGSLSGGKKATKATYVPHVYSNAQTKWIDDFMAQNGYLDYDAVARLGISEPQAFIKRRFGEDKLHFLSTCCVGPQVFGAVESSVEEALSVGSWLDVTPILPSILSPEDAHLILQKVLSQRDPGKGSRPFQVFANTILFTKVGAKATLNFLPVMSKFSGPVG